MSNEKKNPLIGAFRTPAAGAPPTPAPTEPPTEAKPPAAAALPVKAAEVNKAVGPTENGKPAAAPPAPIKPDEGKKPVEPAKDDKAAKDGKPAAAPPAPVKQEEGKKPAEPAKDDNAAKDGKPAAAPPASVKQEEGKKPAEPAKDDKEAKDGKSAATPPAPIKPDESKKPAEPAKDDKAAKDGKSAAAPPAPVKQEEGKKPAEPVKDDKATKDGKPAAAPPAPIKPDEGKKPIEPARDDNAAKDGKPAAVPTTPARQEESKKPPESTKAAETQKPVEQPKEPATAATRTADGPKGSAVTKVFEDRLDAPTEADLFKLPIPNEGEIFSMAVHPAYLRDFLDHPFTVNRETQDYKDLFESIKTYGIREPILCRPGRNGGLEIISGHRRHDIGAQLNYPIPVLIERVDEDDAQIQCVDGNLHRKDIPISELARAAQMKLDALKRKAGRRSKADILAGKEPMKRSDEQVGEDLGMSRASVQRLMRVNQLEEPLKKMVDKKELPLDTAEQISHMKPTEQKALADAIEKEGGKVPSKTEAVKLKEESRAGTLTTQKIEKSVAPTKREIDPPLKVTFQDDELRPYFPDKGTTVATVKRTMFEAMDLRKKALERQKMKMQTEKEPKKKSEPER
ncbi:ParB N-terminal domain-containing protein [Oscillibacter sp. MSJ-31]|uniref:ParB/RepB/Spo0J family partition protein n=1 Tax=Oscillibacter sp. MSJ-31 TaxID=2841526 RepID=UPI001C11361A|nr:ParB N-terminal domain-containing protein [Oscillibacter sp. MSJ-31]MBU5456416.1 ParB N-terminal domain-containing protein [Oscillibacter sp. MSJ-31]